MLATPTYGWYFAFLYLNPPMNRRLLLGTVALSLAALLVPAGAAAATLTPSQQDAVSYAIDAGLLTEGDAGLDTDHIVTRRELVTMTLKRIYPNRDFGRCFEWIAPSLPVTYTKLFSDVLITDDSAESFCAAMVMGLISGQPDGSLKPDTQVSLAEAAKVITRGFGIYQFGRVDPADFPWFVQYIDPLVAHDALPAGLGMENARQRLTVAQVAEIFYVLKDEEVTPDFKPARAAAMIRAANPAPRVTASASLSQKKAIMAQVTTFSLVQESAPVGTPSRRQIVAEALLRQIEASTAVRPSTL